MFLNIIVGKGAAKKGKKLSDIEFLSIKESQGKLRQSDGGLSATGTLCTLTAGAAPNKDMYLAGAKINVRKSSGNSEGDIGVTLVVNGVTIETFSIRLGTGTFLNETNADYEFVSKGFMVETGEIIKLEATLTASIGLSVQGQLVCFEEDTGVSPQIPSI